MVSNELGGCPLNGPLSGTKYPTRAASPIQNASTPKSSLPFSKHRSCALLCAVVRCCAQVLVEHCTEFRTSYISNYAGYPCYAREEPRLSTG